MSYGPYRTTIRATIDLNQRQTFYWIRIGNPVYLTLYNSRKETGACQIWSRS